MLHIANSIWLDNNDTLDVKYAQIVGGYSKQVDFQSIDSPSIVNEWVSNQTDGLVNSIVQEDTPLPGVLIAINSLYLKATWDKEFMDMHTNLDKFYVSPSVALQKRGGGGGSNNIHGDDDTEGVVSMAHFMHNIETLPYSHTILPGYQIVQKGFASSNSLSMIFVRPMNDDNMTPSVPSSKLIPAISNLQETRIALSLPKFKFESVYDDKLKNALQTLGIVSPFQGGTNSLCGIFGPSSSSYPCEQLIISRVLQKTVVDVNEGGVEAAAVTAVFIEKTALAPPIDEPDPILMMMDHPFQFFIYDSEEDLVLFEGRLGSPNVPENEEDSNNDDLSLLELKHSDKDFWQSVFGVNPIDPPTTTVVNPSETSFISPISKISASPSCRGSTTLTLLVGMVALALSLGFVIV